MGSAALEHFRQRGWVRIPQAFSAEAALRLRELIWAELGRRYGAHADQPDSWQGSWSGLKPLGRHPLFRAIANARLGGALDQLVGAGSWRWPRGWHMFLVSPPHAAPGPWRVPEAGWHYDALPQAAGGVNAFVFFDTVAARGGGTLVVEGSHRLLARFLERQGQALEHASFRTVRERFAAHHPWLRRLHGGDAGRSARGLELMRHSLDAEGQVLRVREMTGAAGDVILWSGWLYHVRPSHHLHRPRLMSNVRIPDAARPQPT